MSGLEYPVLKPFDFMIFKGMAGIGDYEKQVKSKIFAQDFSFLEVLTILVVTRTTMESEFLVLYIANASFYCIGINLSCTTSSIQSRCF